MPARCRSRRPRSAVSPRQAVIDGAVAAVQSSILALQTAGAQSFLFIGISDGGGIPEIVPLDSLAAVVGRQASLDLNPAIRAVLPAGAYYVDTIAYSDQLLANPALVVLVGEAPALRGLRR
jgi:hypothetical protein